MFQNVVTPKYSCPRIVLSGFKSMFVVPFIVGWSFKEWFLLLCDPKLLLVSEFPPVLLLCEGGPFDVTLPVDCPLEDPFEVPFCWFSLSCFRNFALRFWNQTCKKQQQKVSSYGSSFRQKTERNLIWSKMNKRSMMFSSCASGMMNIGWSFQGLYTSS